jgi:hypothetical protein
MVFSASGADYFNSPEATIKGVPLVIRNKFNCELFFAYPLFTEIASYRSHA